MLDQLTEMLRSHTLMVRSVLPLTSLLPSKHDRTKCLSSDLLLRPTEVETPNLPGVARQGDHGPRRVGLHIPHLDGFIVTATDNPPTVKLNTADAPRVTLEGPDVTLASHPGPSQLISLHEDLPPVHLHQPAPPPLQLGIAASGAEDEFFSPTERLPQ